MKCSKCNAETYKSIEGKDICPSCGYGSCSYVENIESVPSVDELEHLAYHEAGHAVMSYLLRSGHTNKRTIPLDEFEKVTIQGEMQEWGKITFSLDSLISAAQVLLAGHISEEIKYSLSDDVLYGDSAQDLSAARHSIAAFIEEMTRDSEAVRKQTPKSLELHATLAETGLRCHWLAVEALAQALLKRKTLTGKKAVKIIKAAIARQTHHVLIIDRDIGFGELVALVLKERKKSRTHIIPDGNINLAAIAAEPPDIIFIYWYAVDPDALTFCQQLKSMPQTRAIPVIVWSGHIPDQELYLRLQRAGVAGHLAQPRAPQEILMAHDAVLQGQTYYPPPHARRIKATGERILVVERESDVLGFLGFYLRAWGYDVLLASSGNDALAICRQKLPHLILLDTVLSDMDGYEVCQHLRNRLHARHVPIIVLLPPGEGNDELYRAILNCAYDSITKPLDIEKLRGRVQSALTWGQA